MSAFVRELPADNAATRAALYRGTIVHVAGGPVACALAADVRALLTDAFADVGGPREAAALPNAELFARVGRMRRVLFGERHYRAAAASLLAELGFSPTEVAFDPLKLRVVAHRGHDNPAAAALYAAHRDTWYGHPQCLVTCWLALEDIPAGETFEFFPEAFARAVPNDSGTFDYDAWRRDPRGLRIGWQDPEAGKNARYPALEGEPPGAPLGFSCRAADTLLFSGAHLHRTRRHAAGYTRMSLDFRVVHLADHAAGRGAPNADNASRGSALDDYLRGAELSLSSFS
jgi:hypothetical protein